MESPKKSIVLNAVLSAVSLVAIALVVEVGFRLYIAQNIVYDVEMHKYAKKLKQRSSIAGLTHEHRPGSSAKLMGTEVRINEVGFRDDPMNSIPNDAFRVGLIGSSITMGWGVPFDSVFATRAERQFSLRKNQRPVAIINTGIGNYNTVMEAVLLKKNIDIVNPDMVVLHYFLNDAELISPKNSNALIKNSYVAAFAYVRIKQVLQAHRQNYHNLGEYYAALYSDDCAGWVAAQNAIVEISQICESKNIPFCVLLQPDLHDLNRDGQLYASLREVAVFLDERKIKHATSFDEFERQYVDNPKLLWVHDDDSHPGSAGHAAMAGTLIQLIEPHLSASK